MFRKLLGSCLKLPTSHSSKQCFRDNTGELIILQQALLRPPQSVSISCKLSFNKMRRFYEINITLLVKAKNRNPSAAPNNKYIIMFQLQTYLNDSRRVMPVLDLALTFHHAPERLDLHGGRFLLNKQPSRNPASGARLYVDDVATHHFVQFVL